MFFCVSLSGGCYNPTVPEGVQKCAAVAPFCVDGMSCGPDKYCYTDVAMASCTHPKCSTLPATPICNPKTLSCVQCLADKDCGAGLTCDTKAMMCRAGCSVAHPGCAADAGLCDVDGGICRGCNSDKECTDPKNPRCDVVGGTCQPCVPTNDNCPRDQFCKGSMAPYVCAPGCKTITDCATPDGGVGPAMDCCNHVCLDTTANASNCGVCGKACMGATTCCASSCSDFTTDVKNCGGCGKACAVANVVTPKCAGSTCDYDRCGDGFGDCDANRSNGCETNITAGDAKHCGACNIACGPYTNAIAGCDKAACTIQTCTSKQFADCDGQVGDGCEIDTFSDPNNCGACNARCAPIQAGAPSCKVGVCKAVCTNPNNFADCDGNYADGCETNILTSNSNCGGCGIICGRLTTCQGGLCK